MSRKVGGKNRTRLRTPSQRPRLRLPLQMVFASFLSLVLVEIAWLSVSYTLEMSRVAGRAEQLTRTLLEAAVDPRNFPTLTNEKAVLTRLKNIAHLVGARLEDTAGEPLAVIGQEPEITVLESKRNDIGAKKSADKQYLDIFVPAKDLEFEHPAIVRVDLRPYYADVRRELTSTALTVVNIVVLTTTGLFLALYPILFRPLTRIRDAIMRGVSDLDIADSFMIKWNREDELDDLARAVNQLLFSASKNYNDTLHTAHEAMSASLVATFVYKPGGELTYASATALEFMGIDDLGGIETVDPAFIKIKSRNGGEPMTVEEMVSEGRVADDGEFLTASGPRQVICMGDITYRTDGTVRRIIAQFLDMDLAMERMARLATVSERATKRRLLADQRSLRLRVMLDSCISILDEQDDHASTETDIVDPESTIKEWARVYAAVGKARRVLYNRLPQLSGNPHIIVALFRQTLSYAEFLSKYRNSELRVIASQEEHTVRFAIYETLPDSPVRKEQGETTGLGELTIALSGLKRQVERCDGEIELPVENADMVKFAITIPKLIQSHYARARQGSNNKAAA